jgi:hypothetical protein
MENRAISSRITHHVSRPRIVVGLTLLIVMSSPAVAHAAPLALPPLPPPPPPAPVPAAPSTFTGGFIELYLQFPQAWAQGTHWQDLWTAVQWLDEWGYWRDVEGWQGSLDEVITQADGTVTGHKTWWVTEDDLDRGPFRWRVYRSQGGWLLATSPTFDLPSQRRATTTVEITLRP